MSGIYRQRQVTEMLRKMTNDAEKPPAGPPKRRLPLQDIFKQTQEGNSSAISSKRLRTVEDETETITFNHLPDFYNGKKKIVAGEKPPVQTEVLYTSLLEIENDADDVVNQDEIDRQLREAYVKKAQEKARGEISHSQAQEMVDNFFAEQKFLVVNRTKQIQVLMFRAAGTWKWKSQRDLARLVQMELERKLRKLRKFAVDKKKNETEVTEEGVRLVISRALLDPDTIFNELKKDHLLKEEMLKKLKNGANEDCECC